LGKKYWSQPEEETDVEYIRYPWIHWHINTSKGRGEKGRRVRVLAERLHALETSKRSPYCALRKDDVIVTSSLDDMYANDVIS
jgi:hypothetical protein